MLLTEAEINLMDKKESCIQVGSFVFRHFSIVHYVVIDTVKSHEIIYILFPV